MKHYRLRTLLLPSVLGLTALCIAPPSLQAQGGYRQTNLVSDIPGLAAHTDSHLVNPWGISSGPTSPLWVSNAGTGTSTLYNSSGMSLPLVVTVPGEPTGQVFNANTSFFNGSRFLFASATGTITGWNPSLGTTAQTIVTTPGAAYLGLALAQSGSEPMLYAANFANASVDVFNGSGHATTLSGNFSDPTLPAGYAPFNIQNVGGTLYVAYAKQAGDEEQPGAGLGYVNKFDLNGNFLGRFASNGVLNAPWAITQAPDSFGQFGGDILVGNFGDGMIHAFDPVTGDLVGTLKDAKGNPLVNEGLWGLQFGNGGAGGDRNKLYFAAGIDDESHGLFGSFTPVPEPAAYALAGLAIIGFRVALKLRRRQSVSRPVEG